MRLGLVIFCKPIHSHPIFTHCIQVRCLKMKNLAAATIILFFLFLGVKSQIKEDLIPKILLENDVSFSWAFSDDVEQSDRIIRKDLPKSATDDSVAELTTTMNTILEDVTENVDFDEGMVISL